MKTSKKLNALLLGITTAALMGVGCGKMGEESTFSPALDMSVAPAKKEITFLSLGNPDVNVLKKVTTTSKWMSKSTGGSLHLHHISNGIEVVVDLRIDPNTMSYSTTVSATVDDGSYVGESDVVFGPHGLQFSSPANMTMEAKNLDLSGINPDNIKLYYINDNGQWVEQPCHEIYVNVQWGIIRVVDAKLDHFSRYALGFD